IRHALDSSIDRRLIERSRQLAALGRALAAVSPLGTLERGYAIVRRVADQRVVQDAAEAPVGTQLWVRLHHGQLTCQVEDVSDT
ncbi:MAG: exodeoxyribonuclease VII large subunit, partial [Candidatus Macondimonas sp.]